MRPDRQKQIDEELANMTPERMNELLDAVQQAKALEAQIARRVEMDEQSAWWRKQQEIRTNGFPRQYDPLFIADRKYLESRGIK